MTQSVHIRRWLVGGTILLAALAVLSLPGHASAQTRPIFKSTGGDVVAGASMSTPGEPCSMAQHIGTAGIASWNNHGAPNFVGAGNEYAAMALGVVHDFVTSQGTGRQPAGGETNTLTFSNRDNGPSVDIPNGIFGGLFTDAPCVDYWEKKPPDADLTPFSGGSLSTMNGWYRRTGDVTITASTIPAGSHIVLYVEAGDVAINGNITFQAGTWADRTQIPSLQIIANGVIYIGSGVTRLDGFYAAIPSSNYHTRNNNFANPVRGTISTCSFGFTTYNPNNHLTTPIQSLCNNKLTVNGGLAAKQLWLLRTPGSLAANDPAETINYTPETWLSIDPRGVVQTDTDYQSIIGLPPVL